MVTFEAKRERRELPKVELHLHLDCSLSYQAVHRLAPSLTEEAYRRDFVAPARCTDLADFLTRAPRGVALMQSEAALRLAVEDVFEQLRQDGVVYAEIRFAPLLHTQRGLTPTAVVAAVDDATRLSSARTGVAARLILCTLRHFSEAHSLETAHLVEAFRGTRVVALDLAGDEAGFPIDAHVAAFRHAAECGVFRTAHAGEASGAESVRETLEVLQPARIGHGVRSIEDPELVERLRRDGVHLEVCPTSNIQTGLVSWLPEHPVDRLVRAGVSVGINTDARTISNVTLTQEYERLHDAFGWGADRFLASNLNALAAAFLPEEEKRRLEARIRRGWETRERSG